MKLQCQVEVINRVHSSLNIRSNGKYVKSTLAIGKEPKSETEYFILHFSTVNKSGTKYRVKFIKQVFVKCIDDGKTTIRFGEPPHDLCIKCEAIQLKCFMRLLKSCITGDNKALQVAPLTSLSVTSRDNAPTKLIIHNRSEFPIKGLPRTLQSLTISGLNLCNFRREILMLKNLTYLDMSNNEIEKLPAEFGRLPNLTELYLSNNQLGSKEEIDFKWLLAPQITKTLKLLDISSNKLKYLPKQIWKLQRLVTLKIDNNEIQKLPTTIGRIRSLRYLTMSKNNLNSLPCSLLQCMLEYIDISCNPFHNNRDTSVLKNYSPWDMYVGSLVHLSSKVILKKKIYYAPNIIPWTLVEFLDNASVCICGKPVVNDTYHLYKKFELNLYFKSVVFDSNRDSSVSIECYLCSPKCVNITSYP